MPITAKPVDMNELVRKAQESAQTKVLNDAALNQQEIEWQKLTQEHQAIAAARRGHLGGGGAYGGGVGGTVQFSSNPYGQQGGMPGVGVVGGTAPGGGGKDGMYYPPSQ